jgi:uncharacterized repeat protein (TIGR02543 family)
MAILSSFTAVSAPSPPPLSSPGNGAVDVSLTPTLAWSTAPGASIYHIQVSTSDNFSSISQQDSLVKDTFKTLSALSNTETCYWRVRAKNDGGVSAWSNVWIFTTVAPPRTVTYNGNGNTGGTVPTDANNYRPTATVTVAGNPGSLAKTGFTFAGWNTASNGGGARYSAGQTFPMGAANVVLYAQWNICTFTLIRGHVMGRSAWVADGDTAAHYGDTVPVKAPAIAGGIFIKWRITPNKAFLIDSTRQIAKVIMTNDSAILTAVFSAFVDINNQDRPSPASFDFSSAAGFSNMKIAIPRTVGVSGIPIRICLYDIKGRLLMVLVDKNMQPGYYTLPIANDAVRTGCICRMTANNFTKAIKLTGFNRNRKTKTGALIRSPF